MLVALAIPAAVLLYVALPPFLEFAFGFDAAGTDLLLWVTRAFLVGLLSHCLLELAARIFFAQQNALFPFIAAALNLAAYAGSGLLLMRSLQAPGLALADAISFTVQSGFLLLVYKFSNLKRASGEVSWKSMFSILSIDKNTLQTLVRTLFGSVVGAAVIWLIIQFSGNLFHDLITGTAASFIGLLAVFPFIRRELGILLRL